MKKLSKKQQEELKKVCIVAGISISGCAISYAIGYAAGFHYENVMFDRYINNLLNRYFPETQKALNKMLVESPEKFLDSSLLNPIK